MQTLFEDVELEPSGSSADPWSETFAVKQITQDRAELHNVLRGMMDDPRVIQFLMVYESHYKQLVVSNTNRLNLRESVRELGARRKVSGAKSSVVDDIYKPSDDHIGQLRREINVVYHQLIEAQDAEDATRETMISLSKTIADLNARVRERQQGVPQAQMKLKEKLENKCDELRAERDRHMAEVDRLREEFSASANQEVYLEKSRLRVEEKIAETQREFSRVNNDIAKETQKKARFNAALLAAQQQQEDRDRDMEDLTTLLSDSTDQCKALTDTIHSSTVKAEKMRITSSVTVGKMRSKQQEYDELMEEVRAIETEVSHHQQDVKKRTLELEAAKELSAHMDKICRTLKNKIREMDLKKATVNKKKERQKQKNQKLLEEIQTCRKNMENALKEQTDFIKKRECLRKALMKETAIMQKDHLLLTLHQLANKRLTQDNNCLVEQTKDQHRMISKLENERDSYIRQAVHVTRKVVSKAEEERKSMEAIFSLMKLIANEETKMLETQNLFEATRNEHALYTRHILQLKDFIGRLKAKSTAMTYETHKLLQERDYRDECLIQEELALQKLSRQIFILKVNLRDLKESNARTKLIIENQDLEEKNLIKMTRIMKLEKVREVKGLERVIRDIDGLDLALTRRHHELHDLYEMVKLKQSLLEKGENMYSVRWKEYVTVKEKLQRASALRRLDCKNRAIVDRLIKCVKILTTHLENVRLRSKGLMEELSHPHNIHRWRNLLSRDPYAYESVRQLHKIRHAIQENVAHTSSTMTQIHMMDREYISLTSTILMQPSPETVLQLKLYQEDLHTRCKQIKKLTVEMRELLDSKTDMVGRRQAIDRKLKTINDMWVQHMKKEKKRAAKETLTMSGPLPLLPGPEGLSNEARETLLEMSPMAAETVPRRTFPSPRN